jgi:hypothetical protein
MSNSVERAFISLLMELPFYFTLSVKERLSLLSRLTKYYEGLIKEYEREQDLHIRVVDT